MSTPYEDPELKTPAELGDDDGVDHEGNEIEEG